MVLGKTERTLSVNLNKFQSGGRGFNRLLLDFINGEGANNFINNQKKVENKTPYDELIFATGSTRKALLLSSKLNNTSSNQTLPAFDDPRHLQDLFEDKVFNGNGSLGQKTLVGSHRGIPFYAESAAEGETKGNDPEEEAKNKARYLAKKYYDQGKRVLIIAGDTVTDGLGKPMDLPDFPKDSYLIVKNLNSDGFIKNFAQRLKNGGKSHNRALEEYADKYLQKEFSSREESVHVNAISIFEVLKNSSMQEMQSLVIVIKNLVSPERYSEMTFYPDLGGSGAAQQFIDWGNKEEIFKILDDETQSLLKPTYDVNEQMFKMLVMYQIMGMPSPAILQKIDEVIVEEIQKIKDGSEMILGNDSAEDGGTKTTTKVA